MGNCELCQKRPAIKTNGKGQEVCGKCARGVRKPFRYRQHVGRNDPCPCGSGKKSKRCGCRVRRNAQLPNRPAHWLPNEPLIVAMPATEDGFVEIHLELGGRVVATRVATPDGEWNQMVFDHFNRLIKEDLEANQ